MQHSERLVRARDTLARAPNACSTRCPSPPVGCSHGFQDCSSNVGRRDAAADVLARLKGELRLDALNVKFLEVQLLATFGDWTGIVDHPGFAKLCLARRTAPHTAQQNEAIYKVHLDGPFDAGEADETRVRFEIAARPLAQPMLRVPVPSMLTTGGWRVYGLEAWISTSRTDVGAALVGHLDALGLIADRLARRHPMRLWGQSSNEHRLTMPATRSLVQWSMQIDSVDALASAVKALAKLSPEDLALLREAEPFRSAFHVTEESADVGLTTSWIKWFERAVDPSFTSALDTARHGMDEWPIGLGAGDPAAVQAFVSALEKAQSDDLACDRIVHALPFLVAWLQRDPDFPQAAMVPVYANLLTLFALGSARGSGTYESSQILVSAVLSAGLDVKAYRALIADVEELAGEGFGLDMIYWVMEIIEDFMRASTPAAEARESFCTAHFRAWRQSTPDWSELAAHCGRTSCPRTRLDTPIIWNHPRAERFRGRHQENRRPTHRNLFIDRVLEPPSEGCDRGTRTDSGRRLQCRSWRHSSASGARAENADIFVVTWLSAKHGCDRDFIREHRGGRPLLYAQGRGFSSILRAVEDHVRRL